MKKTIVVIGGAHGGPTAAASARQFNEDAHIILVEQALHVTWVQADLRHYLSGDLTRLERKLAEKEQYFSRHYNVDVRVKTQATGIDLDSRLVFLKKGNEVERVRFDSVIFAGGACSKELNSNVLAPEDYCNFRNLTDVLKLKAAFQRGIKKAAILGCGFYGVEALQALLSVGLEVDIIEKQPQVFSRFNLPTAQAIAHALNNTGAKLHLNDEVVEIATSKKSKYDLKLQSGKIVAADFIVVAVGSVPRTDVLRGAGAALQKDGSIRVDEAMQTSLPGVYACGSAVSVLQTLTNKRIWVPQPSIVSSTARVAGHNAACFGENALEKVKAVTGTQTLCVGDHLYCRTGLTFNEARKHFGENQVFWATVHSHAAETWVEGEDITVSLLIEKQGGTIVGGEVWGKSGVSRRIDLVSVAIQEKWKPEKLLELDIAYAPQIGPAFDPLKEAGKLGKLSLLKQTEILSGESLALWIAQKRNFFILDVSKDKGEAYKNLDNVSHIPLEELRQRFGEVEKKGPIVVSSRSGRRSFLAYRILNQMGFKDVYHLDGGALSWSRMMGEA